ncbi:hypothetical protein V2J09_020539 [Rumex salicifolius]
MGEMMINIKSTSMVDSSQESPKRRLWISNVDHVVGRRHIPNIYFYRPNGSPGFFDPNLLKEALSRALIPFYPVAGRFRRDADGRRIEIDCNDEGVLFVEAETTSVVDDFGDFGPTMEYKKIHFINAWADLARGLDLATSPTIDRTLLRARDPPCPLFQHVEYHPSPTLLTPNPTSTTISARAFNITGDQINALKANSKEDGKTYTSFEILSAHIWRCVCKARGLSDTQPSKLYIPVDARSRLEPYLPPMYIGNAVLMATPVASAGDLVSNPASYAADKIHESVARMDDAYLRSTLNYIELNLDKDALLRGPRAFECPNLGLTSWTRLPVYEADFGWGRPTFMGPGWINAECSCFLVPRDVNDGKMIINIKSTTMVQPRLESPKRRLWTSNVDLVVSTFTFTVQRVAQGSDPFLIPYYPVAGRLRRDADERSIATTKGCYSWRPKRRRLWMILVYIYTSSKCYHAHINVSLINTWANMARGLEPSVSPFIDRTLLRARETPSPKFHHVEYQPSPALLPRPTSVTRAFNLTRDQINALKKG